MRLSYDADVEAFRADLVGWLEANAPSPDQMSEAKRSSGHLPDWARRWQRTLFDAGWLVPGWPPRCRRWSTSKNSPDGGSGEH
jgi:hypothetical protein